LIAELAPGAFDGVAGVVRPDWNESRFVLPAPRAGAKLGEGRNSA